MEEAALALLGWRKEIEQLKQASSAAEVERQPQRWESVHPTSLPLRHGAPSVDREKHSKGEDAIF